MLFFAWANRGQTRDRVRKLLLPTEKIWFIIPHESIIYVLKRWILYFYYSSLVFYRLNSRRDLRNQTSKMIIILFKLYKEKTIPSPLSTTKNKPEIKLGHVVGRSTSTTLHCSWTVQSNSRILPCRGNCSCVDTSSWSPWCLDIGDSTAKRCSPESENGTCTNGSTQTEDLKRRDLLDIMSIFFIVDGVGQYITTVFRGVGELKVHKTHLIVIPVNNRLNEFTAEILIAVVASKLGILVVARVRLVVFVTTSTGKIHIQTQVTASMQDVISQVKSVSVK